MLYFLLGPSTGDIAQLVERRPCEWVVALTGWVPNCLGGNDSISHLNWWLTLPKNGGEDQNMPLRDPTGTKMSCRVGRGGMGGWLDPLWVVHGR